MRARYIVSPNEVDDRLITDERAFGPRRRAHTRLGPAIQDALKIGRDRMKRGRWRPVGVYACAPAAGCSIVGYTSTDDNDRVIWSRY